MCRLASGNAETLKKIEKEKMSNIFSFLENRQGGHGNGIGMFKAGKFYRLRGENISVKKITDMLYAISPDLWTFHTRITSSGQTATKHNHPHKVLKDGKLQGLLSQNGTLSLYDERIKFFQSLFGGEMDAEIIANAIGKTDALPINFLLSLNSSVWLYLTPAGVLSVNSGHGDLITYKNLCLTISEKPGKLLKHTGSGQAEKIYHGGYILTTKNRIEIINKGKKPEPYKYQRWQRQTTYGKIASGKWNDPFYYTDERYYK